MGGKFRAFIKFLIVVALIGSACLRGYRTFIPEGAEFKAYALDLIEGPEYPSDGLRPKLNVNFEDNGDDHGGNYRTWLVKNHWLWGKKVLIEGWSTHEVVRGRQDFPLKWLTDDSVEVKFYSKEIGGTLKPTIVIIPKNR